MNWNTKNIAMFTVALRDCFKDDEDRELDAFSKISLEEERGSELIFEMLAAFHAVFMALTGTECDALEFLGILNRLVFQDAIERTQEGKRNEDTGKDE